METAGQEPWSRNHAGNDALLAQSRQRKSVTAVDSGFLKDMLQMNFDGSRADAKFGRDFPVLKALLYQFKNLLFSGRQFRVKMCFRYVSRFAEYGVLHPAPTLSDHPETGEYSVQIGAFAQNSSRPRL
jgi:hypothetical protein